MTTTPVPSQDAQRFFPAVPASIAIVRDFAGETLAAWDVAGRADDVRLCVSELASNALTHGTLPGRGFLVRMAAADGWLRVEVHDSSEREPRLRHPGRTDASGRGLLIVDALSDGWGVEDREPLGKVVWSRFRAEPAV
ncbi:ATP-binding protein [Streptomyces sp. H39-S7]|uniref:ATP-binding protein n=1 Tax=Streptomyces sp. H39-S7 TaxID=3004357 RepID=UPI0022AF9FCF|nr:ATP-binding protein [Streptomyces sp. H39-S7]MCZ4122124.1 ATP-binding protein [Streptomyces sp. H39-S7]